jgi:hypothetical protein
MSGRHTSDAFSREGALVLVEKGLDTLLKLVWMFWRREKYIFFARI